MPSKPKLTGQKQRHSVARPCRHAGTKKVSIFGPDRTINHHGAGQNRPVISITHGNPLKGLLLQVSIEIKFERLNNGLKGIQNRHRCGTLDTTLLQ